MATLVPALEKYLNMYVGRHTRKRVAAMLSTVRIWNIQESPAEDLNKL
jgi:hypothetical protein